MRALHLINVRFRQRTDTIRRGDDNVSAVLLLPPVRRLIRFSTVFADSSADPPASVNQIRRTGRRFNERREGKIRVSRLIYNGPTATAHPTVVYVPVSTVRQSIVHNSPALAATRDGRGCRLINAGPRDVHISTTRWPHRTFPSFANARESLSREITRKPFGTRRHVEGYHWQYKTRKLRPSLY